MTVKQRVVLRPSRESQHARDGEAVGAGTIAAACPEPWHKRPDLVTQALLLLGRDVMVLAAAGSTRAWKITAAGRMMLPPRRGPARERRVGRGRPHAR